MQRIINRVVLVDRDGVINRDIPGSVCSMNQFQFLPGSVQAIVQLCSLGYRVLVITNQACIGRGKTDINIVEMIHQKMRLDIRNNGGIITDIFMCPHAPEDNCSCRKPLPGMIFEAQEKFQFILEQTWFVGDAVRDIEAAQSAGCRPAGVLTGLGAILKEKFKSIPMFNDLMAFSNFLKIKNRCFFD